MIKKLTKTDRYILIISSGILLISIFAAFDKISKKKFNKEKAKLAQQELFKRETDNTKIWRRFHEEQMSLMKEILKELKQENKISDSKPLKNRMNTLRNDIK